MSMPKQTKVRKYHKSQHFHLIDRTTVAQRHHPNDITHQNRHALDLSSRLHVRGLPPEHQPIVQRPATSKETNKGISKRATMLKAFQRSVGAPNRELHPSTSLVSAASINPFQYFLIRTLRGWRLLGVCWMASGCCV